LRRISFRCLLSFYDCFFGFIQYGAEQFACLTAFWDILLAIILIRSVSQIHDKQTDLPKVSYLFCVLFLPAANMLMVGSMLAFNTRGWDGVVKYNELIAYLNHKNLNMVLSFLDNLF
jgi:hypothetical protein